MALSIGTQLGSHEIIALVGKGGMGEVYRARDLKLKREVAIKILPDEFSSDADRVNRFQREAEVLASLNHPNIAAIHDIAEAKGSRYLVLELVEGETLADRIARGPIPVQEALNIAAQICEALEAAHENGIIHRDLKPANVKLTPDGKVKVLDFGLAKGIENKTTTLSNSPTMLSAATNAGVILGTASYMAPEQATGKPTDRRSDIFSFGAVFFEMLSGQSAFNGDSVGEILASVLKEEPDWNKLPADTPSFVRTLLRRCLTKDRKQRLQAIGEARIALENPFIPSNGPLASQAASRSLAWPLVAAALALGLAIVAIGHFREFGPAAATPFRFQVFPPEKTTFDASMKLSPDGHVLAFVGLGEDGHTQIWVRDLNSLESRPLAGTTGATFIFWSPDSRYLAFTDGSRLNKIDIAGGGPQLICEVPGKRIGQGAWNKDGVILFGIITAGIGDSEGLRRVAAAGGMPAEITRPDPAHPGEFHDFASFLSDGRRFLYLRITQQNMNGIYSGSLDSPADHQSNNMLVRQSGGFVYVPPSDTGGHVGKLFSLNPGRSVVMQPFDEKQMALTGEAISVGEQVGNLAALGFFTAATNVLAYRSGGETVAQLTWLDRQGKNLGTLGPPQMQFWASVSPDGNTVAIDRGVEQRAGNSDIWTYSLVRGTASRLTFNSMTNRFPIWSPDSSSIAFTSADKDGSTSISKKASNGTGPEEVLHKDARVKIAYDWSRDGQYIIEGVLDAKSKYDIWVLPVAATASGAERKPFPYLQTEFNEQNARLSPDGRWLAYSSDETGRDEIYVQTFPQHGGKWQVSANGGSRPVWSYDGKQLFFTAGDGKMTAVVVKTTDPKNSQFEAGSPVPLFDAGLGILSATRFDVAKDGRFLIPRQASQTAPTPINILVNWEPASKN